MGISLVTPNRGRNSCLICRDTNDVSSLRFATGDGNGIVIDLCKNCRNLLHKRLHEEESK